MYLSDRHLQTRDWVAVKRNDKVEVFHPKCARYYSDIESGDSVWPAFAPLISFLLSVIFWSISWFFEAGPMFRDWSGVLLFGTFFLIMVCSFIDELISGEKYWFQAPTYRMCDILLSLVFYAIFFVVWPIQHTFFDGIPFRFWMGWPLYLVSFFSIPVVVGGVKNRKARALYAKEFPTVMKNTLIKNWVMGDNGVRYV